MASKTNFYNMGYFDFGDILNSGVSASLEIDRFLLIDKQLYGIYQVFGNGVISGWELTDNGFSDQNGISLSVGAGVGIIKSLASETFSPKSVNLLPPNSTLNIYAIAQGFTFSSREVDFLASTSEVGGGAIFLGQITTGSNSILTINTENRTLISFEQLVQNQIDTHKHRGTPSKIDLTKEVKNQLTSSKIEDFDAEKVQVGRLDQARIPALNHNDLLNNGILTHAQLDSFVQTLSSANAEILGEVSTANRILQTLFLKYQYSNADEFMYNEIDYIPGISPDSYMDEANSTAFVDTISKCVVGSVHSERPLYFYTKNFQFDSPVKKVFITSTKGQNGTVQFGVNFDDSTDFENDYNVISENQVASFEDNLANSFRVGIKLDSDLSNTVVDFDDQFGPYFSFLYTNTIDFDFENSGATDTFNFRIRFYSDAGLNDLVHTADTNLDVEGFAIDGSAFTLGGESITGSTTANIIYDATNESSIVCDEYYYVVLDYDQGSGWTEIVSGEAFTKQCSPSFTDLIDFQFVNDTLLDTTYHFRVRFFDDNERTNQVLSFYSGDSQTNWVINDSEDILIGGYTMDAGEEINITFLPVTTSLTAGQTYYLIIDAWNGTEYVFQNSEFTFVASAPSSSCDQYTSLALVRNFGVIFELEDGSFTKVS